MSDHRQVWGGRIRKLWPTESEKFRDHLLRLNKQDRRMRFANSVSDDFIKNYAACMPDMGSIVFAYIKNGEVHAAAELRKLSIDWGPDAEAAFSVEEQFQHQGIGTALMGRIIRSARNRSVRNLYMSCLSENARMQRIARKFEAQLRFEYGEVVGEIAPDRPSQYSYLNEAMDDRVGFLLAVLDLQNGFSKAA